MPCIEIYTNIPEEKIPETFHLNVTNFFCALLEKEPRGVVLSLYPNQKISLGKNLKEECVIVLAHNAEAFLDAKDNKEFIRKVTDELAGRLRIKKERISVMLLSLTSHTVCTPIGLLAERGPFKWRFKYLEDLQLQN
ncbi:hypothetical protein HOLleu_16253 [Holothuria leucospilota]|uniref:Macrophage migration inhibitory factor n=1 Tax=Holothuria leucospilota TaxID=206669 RepID=A0A9Q1HAT1_HOLLE|nr:hypothetical protein HOLleu_16253 [Holothuria leucospilota]